MNELDQLVASVRNDQHRETFITPNWDNYPLTAQKHIGYVLGQSRPESRKDFSVNFDPVQNLYLEHLVSQQTLDQRIIIEKHDFFKGVVFLDYAATVLFGHYELNQKHYDMALQLDRAHPGEDPTLPMIADLVGRQYFDHYQNDRLSAQRYQGLDHPINVEYVEMRQVNPLYQVMDMAEHEPVKRFLEHVTSSYQIKAALFTDAILGHVDVSDRTVAALEEKDPYKASKLAVMHLAKAASNKDIDAAIEAILDGEDQQYH